MALTRKFLKAMGIEDEKVDQIIDAHTETVSGLKDQIDTLKKEAGETEDAKTKLAEVQKQLDKANADLEATKKDGWKDKHDALKKEFEDYKAGVTAKETKAAKESAARSYYESKGITGKSLEIAMRGSGAEIEGLELEDGKIKDAAALDALVNGDFSDLVSKQVVKVDLGGSLNGGKSPMTKDEIMSIKDAGERQRAIAENGKLFGF